MNVTTWREEVQVIPKADVWLCPIIPPQEGKFETGGYFTEL